MGKKNFASRLKDLISELEVSDREFSASIGKSASYINTLKKENSNPRLDVIESILDVYSDVSLYWLVRGIGDMHLSNEEAKFKNNENLPSQNKDYKTLFEEYRAENKRLLEEHHILHQRLLDLMDKNSELITENTAMKLAQLNKDND